MTADSHNNSSASDVSPSGGVLYMACGRCNKLRAYGDTSVIPDVNLRKCEDCGCDVVLGTPDEAVTIVDEFVIKREIGHGGAATVYLANQAPLDRLVALKIGHSPDPDEVKGLLSEARLAAKVSHPSLAQVYKFGTWNDLWFLAMEFIDGPNLKSHVSREGPLDWVSALKVTLQVACALEVVWTEIGLVHRDIKPENILLPKVGPAKLVDLGLAISSATPIGDDSLAGTPHFMSPEQFRGEKLDVRSDLYGLGATLYYLLTGDLPYEGKNPVELGRKHLSAPIPQVKDSVDVPDSVNDLVARMMAKDKDSRYSIFVLINILRSLLAEGVIEDADDLDEYDDDDDFDDTEDVEEKDLPKAGKPTKKMKASRLRKGRKTSSSRRKIETSKIKLKSKSRGSAKINRKGR